MYFDDLHEGDRFETAGRTLSRDDIVAFARQWDPQAFHLDEEAACASPYGGLIASGFHTMLTAFMLTPRGCLERGVDKSPGMDDIRWLRPVYPGDTLRVEAEDGEKRALGLASRPRAHDDPLRRQKPGRRGGHDLHRHSHPAPPLGPGGGGMSLTLIGFLASLAAGLIGAGALPVHSAGRCRGNTATRCWVLPPG